MLTSIVVGKVFNAASLFTVVFLVSITTCYVFIYISKVTPESIFDTSLLPHRFHMHTSWQEDFPIPIGPSNTG